MREEFSREIARLELLIYREVLRLRAAYALSLDEFRGLHVGDELVERLVGRSASADPADVDLERLTREAESLERDLAPSPIRALRGALGLTPFECDVVLLSMASELDLKYELVIAYLNNDATRKLPNVDLALRLFGDERRLLQRDARLFRDGILEPAEGPRAGLRLAFTLSPIVSAWLLGLQPFDPALAPFARAARPVSVSERTRERIERLAEGLARARSRAAIVLSAEDEDAQAAAIALLSALGQHALAVDVATESLPISALCLTASLSRAGVVLDATSSDARPEVLSRIVAALFERAIPTVLLTSPSTPWRSIVRNTPAIHLAIDAPNAAARRAFWSEALNAGGVRLPEELVDEIAHQFRLGTAQIESAVETLRVAAPDEKEPVKERAFRAAREQSTADLGSLASRISSAEDWSALVLPAVVEQRLREVCKAVRARPRVFGEWGFSTRGTGLMVLFAGSSGTGKTMSASMIAREVGLDLYRIDLAGVVSKYIGETEKNLNRIFDAARAANVILFFDEADALLGKRSAVKDAHDRYANIEVAYLLQKMEEHDGVVILASNLAKNMDAAFSRRMHFVVEFPRPDETLRARLWRTMFRAGVPLDADADLDFLARQFDLSGGEIRAVALDAAFGAASAARAITMGDLVSAVARQMQKQGRPLGASDLKHHRRPS